MNRNAKKLMGISIAMTIFMAAIVVITFVAVAAPHAGAQAAPAKGAPIKATAPAASDEVAKMAFLSSALVVGVACIAAGIAVGMTGSAAIGAVAEKPELMGRTIIFVGLAEGIAIYGLIIAIMILGKVG